MISFFTSLKPFRGTTAVQQRNALRSWYHSVPGSEIIVLGAVEDGDDVIAEVKATYRPDIACNEFGTPLISAMFVDAQRIGRYSLLCYINGDILLLPDFAAAVARLTKWKTFAAVGQHGTSIGRSRSTLRERTGASSLVQPSRSAAAADTML